MVPGENPGDWGDRTNTNLRGIEEAICQTNNVTFAGTATVALSITDFTDPPQIGRGFRLNLTGTGTAGQILQVPDIQKSYIINNGLAVDTTVKNSTSSPTVLVPAGKSAFVYSLNSAGVTNAITTLPSANISGTFEISGNASVGGTLNIGNTTTSKSISADGTLNVGSNASVTGTLGVTGDTDLANLSASGTFDVAGNASVGGTLKVTGAVTAASTLNVGSNVSVGGTLGVTGDTDVANLSASGTFDVAGNASVGGTHTVTGYYKNSSGNLIIEPATYIAEIRGGSSTDGQIQLNCRSNSHGQKIMSQPHSESVTNEMLLPKGANSTLVSEVGTATVTNKTLDAIVSVSASGALNIGGAITGSSTVSDQDGDLRNLQISHSGKATYTLTTNDTGQMVRLDSAGIGALIPSATFAVGDIISIMNTTSTTGSITSQITMHVGGAASATGTATLGINNIANIYFVSADGCIVTGGAT